MIAHRGASAYRPEHTFAAWDLALEMGADYIEQDLRMTADSALVVLHDETLDRTASGRGCTGPVRAFTLDELRPCRVATFDSVLTRYSGRARFYVETKAPDDAPGMEEALVTLLERHDLLPVDADRRVIVQSFSDASLRRMAELAPSVPRVQLVRRRESRADLWRRLPAMAEYAQGVGPAAADLEHELVQAAHARCLEVHPYTVNDPGEMRRLLRIGVDGLFTDRPDVLARLRDGVPLADGVRRWDCPSRPSPSAGRPREGGADTASPETGPT